MSVNSNMSAYFLKVSEKSNNSVKNYIINKMVNKGYPEHVGADFVTSLMRNVKVDDNLFTSTYNNVLWTRYNGDDDDSTVETRSHTSIVHTLRQSGK